MWDRRSTAFRVLLLALVAIVVLTLGAMLLSFSAGSYDAAPVSYRFTATAAHVEAIPTWGADQPVSLRGDSAYREAIPTQQRVIIRNAVLNLTVADPAETLESIMALASEIGGWVVTSNVSRFTTDGHDMARGTITVRVPAERLDEALERIKDGALAVNSENVTGQDVTGEYVDLSSRLGNLEAAESQLQEIMDSAESVEDVLAVHAELTRIRGEIESIRGQLQYYDQASAFSSIRVDLLPKPPDPVKPQSESWNPVKTAESAFDALTQLIRVLIDLAITLVVILGPLLVIVGVPGWFIYRWVHRRIQTQKSNE